MGLSFNTGVLTTGKKWPVGGSCSHQPGNNRFYFGQGLVEDQGRGQKNGGACCPPGLRREVEEGTEGSPTEKYRHRIGK